MYSKIKNIQIIVSLMKQHGIRHIVLSAGTRHVPIAHSVENDPFFKCYSVVDERSAGYFAIGLAKELGEPVAIACTSSTATCNYTPPIAEAYYQRVPLLILTGDRDPYQLNQLEDQMINQVDMYRNFCKRCVNLPVVNTPRDEWYCTRLVNEAILELNHHGCGPVQINFPIVQTIEDIADASVEELPVYNKIERVDVCSGDGAWRAKLDQLKKFKRIMVLCGSAEPAGKAQADAMCRFEKKFNCVIATEKVSNLPYDWAMDTYLIGESISGEIVRTVVAPDLVIFLGGNFVSRWKTMLRGQKAIFESWVIMPNGEIMDPFQNLSTVFECTPEKFFAWFAENAGTCQNDHKLRASFERLSKLLQVPPMDKLIAKVNGYTEADARFKKLPPPSAEELVPQGYLSAFSAMYGLAQCLPENCLVHLSILNSTRIMQMFDMPKGAAVYSNIGTDGIDGSMSTFFGQATATERPCYLVIGDLSFFYDMNAVGLRNLKGNVHILLVNNGGGAEFYFSMGPKLLPNIDMHISAAHKHSAKAWVESNGFDYMSANSQESFDKQIAAFAAHRDKPVIFEIFTDKLRDVKVLKGFQRSIRQDTAASSVVKQVEKLPVVKQALETETGKALRDKLKNGFKKVF